MFNFHSQALISVKIDSTISQFPIYHWTQVLDLKTRIFQLSNIPVCDQRLYIGHIELSNNRLLADYSLFSNKSCCGIVLEYSKLTGNFIRRVPGAFCDQEFLKDIQKVNQALKMGFAPQLTWDGTAGVYLMRDGYKTAKGVFKPLDEEACAPLNPRGHVGKLLSTGIRPGIRSGEGGYREIAAFFIDYNSFSGVPKTALVESQHPTYKYGNEKHYAKKGSFQQFVNNKGAIEDFSVTLFSKFEIQKIAILDIRILNMDRNEGNILVTNENKLIPIDHSLSMPETLEISEIDLCWMNFPQCREQLEENCFAYIQSLDSLKDINLIRNTVPIRNKSLLNLRIACEILKKGAKVRLTLQQIGSLLYRKEDESSHSVVEKILIKSLELHKSIEKSLHKVLKLENRLSSIPNIKARERSYSENDEFLENTKIQNNEEFEEVREIFVSIKEMSEEYESDESFGLAHIGRSLSLPCLENCNSRYSNIEDDFAFNQKLFYYIESFLELAVERKSKEIERKQYLGNKGPNGRPRSVSDAFAISSEF